VPSHIHVPCRVTDQVIDDNHRPCCVCYSEEGQLSVGYKSGGEEYGDDDDDDDDDDFCSF